MICRVSQTEKIINIIDHYFKPEHRELPDGYVEGSEEVDPVDDLVTAGSGQGPIVGAVDGSSGSSYRGNP